MTHIFLGVRFGVSSRAEATFIANLVNESGGNIKDVKLSQSTANCKRKAAVSSSAASIRDQFKEKLENLSTESKKKSFVLHLDGKSVEEYTNGRKETNERIAVICSSPEFSPPQIIAIPKINSSSGEDIVAGIMEVICSEDLDLSEYLCGLSFDTTAANTGEWNGACVGIEEALGTPLLWLPCRHHVHELHVKHAAAAVGRPTKSPEDALHGRLKDN